MSENQRRILRCKLVLAAGLLLCSVAAPARQKPVPAANPAGASSRSAVREAPAARPAKRRADVAAFRARLEATLAEARADKGYWGVLVTDAATGEVLLAMNSQRYFQPASNTKLLTTALALATLGPEFRFRTTLEARSAPDDLGRLHGDLVLVGRGDPNLSNRKFPYQGKIERDGPAEKILAELADAVVARNIKQIDGDVVADDSYFDYERFPSGWEIDDFLWGYGAALSAISFQDNVISLELRPGGREGDPAWFIAEPWTDYYKFQNDITTGPAGSERKLQVSRDPGSRLFALRGTIPLGAEPHTLTLAVEEPAEHAARVLKRLLEARGVRIQGEARARHAPAGNPGGATLLAEHTSLPLLEAVRLTNKISQNLHAELLLRTAAREKTGATSAEAALKFAQEFFLSAGIAEGDVALSDGSGLSRRNLVTPQAIVQLLQYIARQPWGEAFRGTLPVAGQDGTLEDRMKDTPAAGRLWAKTGTLEHTSAISGYATTLRGEKLIFSVFGNNHTLRSRGGSSVLDAICVAMVEQLGLPPRKGKK